MALTVGAGPLQLANFKVTAEVRKNVSILFDIHALILRWSKYFYTVTIIAWTFSVVNVPLVLR